MLSNAAFLLCAKTALFFHGSKWRATAEAARALTAASRILARARRITILCVSENEAGGDKGRLSAEHLASQLAWVGIKPEVRSAIHQRFPHPKLCWTWPMNAMPICW